jgi:hypothetical protein
MAMYKVKFSASVKMEIDAANDVDAINKARENYDLGKELSENVSINVKKS